MKLLLLRAAIRLIPPEKAIKIIVWGIVGAFFVLVLLFIAPFLIYTHIPYGQEIEHFNFYSDAVKEIERITDGVQLNWQEVMALDAVLLEQNFELSSYDRALEMAWLFIREEEELIEKTCTRMVRKEDENGNIVTVRESYDCSYYVTKYYAKSLDTVLNELVALGTLKYEQIEEVKRYTLIDLTQITDDVILPIDWRPVGDFAWPVKNVYTITSTFGVRVDPFTGGLSSHNGIDIGAPIGTDVVAIDSGWVIFSGARGSAGNAVIIKHADDVQSRYYHLHSINVATGDFVEKGDKIGVVGSTGRSTGPHLHLEIHIGSQPVDPLRFYQ